MYQLTSRMEQHFRQSLAQYHNLFDGGRCQGWELEELIVKAIKADTSANHLPRWQEAGHDDKEDILVVINGDEHQVQIKSGRIKITRDKESFLVLSGHRLGRFRGNLEDISVYLNDKKANIISVPYRKHEDDEGRKHIYRLCYVSAEIMHGIDYRDWNKIGARFETENKHGVKLRLMPSMSWQIWWDIPLSVVDLNQEFSNGRFIVTEGI